MSDCDEVQHKPTPPTNISEINSDVSISDSAKQMEQNMQFKEQILLKLAEKERSTQEWTNNLQAQESYSNTYSPFDETAEISSYKESTITLESQDYRFNEPVHHKHKKRHKKKKKSEKEKRHDREYDEILQSSRHRSYRSKEDDKDRDDVSNHHSSRHKSHKSKDRNEKDIHHYKH